MIKLKKIKVVIVIICFIIVLVIFGFKNINNRNIYNKYNNIEVPKKIKAALLLSGSPSEKYSKSYYNYKAFKKLEENYGIEFLYNEYVNFKNITYFLNEYSKKGYNFIIINGKELEDYVFRISMNYPEIAFICIGGENGKNNVSTYKIKKEDLIFISGAITAGITERNQIGFMEYESGKSYKKNFELGAKSYNNEITVTYNKIEDINKDFSNELISFSRNNINTICFDVNSASLEEAIVNTEMNGVSINGNNEDGLEKNKFIRISINYDIIYDKIYKDYIEKRIGKRVELGFRDNIFVIKENGYINDNLNIKISELINSLI